MDKSNSSFFTYRSFSLYFRLFPSQHKNRIFEIFHFLTRWKPIEYVFLVPFYLQLIFLFKETIPDAKISQSNNGEHTFILPIASVHLFSRYKKKKTELLK